LEVSDSYLTLRDSQNIKQRNTYCLMVQEERENKQGEAYKEKTEEKEEGKQVKNEERMKTDRGGGGG
jgi:hypothetical protein